MTRRTPGTTSTVLRYWTVVLATVVLHLAVSGCTPTCPDDVSPVSDDPENLHQWYLPALGAEEGWQVQRGHPSIIVAVIDNGFDLAHPDLVEQLWTNEGEVENGVDDDANGYVDDLYGWDFLDDDADATFEPGGDLAPALLGHGTGVAGIIGASTDNGLGVAGMCPNCRLMLLRARDFRDAHNVMAGLAEALDYAVANGARVVNISDGVPEDRLDPEIAAEVEAAIDAATRAGVVVVASAGNDGADLVRWPARLESVISVAAVDAQQHPMSWTSYGVEVDLAAPGNCVFTTGLDGGYRYAEGTSASAPIVSGLAALLLATHPAWGLDDVVQRLRTTAMAVQYDTRPGLEGLLGAGVAHFAALLE